MQKLFLHSLTWQWEGESNVLLEAVTGEKMQDKDQEGADNLQVRFGWASKSEKLSLHCSKGNSVSKPLTQSTRMNMFYLTLKTSTGCRNTVLRSHIRGRSIKKNQGLGHL